MDMRLSVTGIGLLLLLTQSGCAALLRDADRGPGAAASLKSSARKAGRDVDPEFLAAHGVGSASYYAHRFHGRRTASGRTYDENELTAAHRTLPFGSTVRVTNLANQRSVVVTVTDRGPFVRNRVIDLSRRAASQLGFISKGIARVKLELLKP